MTGPWRRAGSRGPTVFCCPLNERGRGPDSSLLLGEGRGGFTSHSTQGKTKKVFIYSDFVSFFPFFLFFLKPVRPLGLNGCPRRQWRRFEIIPAGIFHGTDIKGFPPKPGSPKEKGRGTKRTSAPESSKPKASLPPQGGGLRGRISNCPPASHPSQANGSTLEHVDSNRPVRLWQLE